MEKELIICTNGASSEIKNEGYNLTLKDIKKWLIVKNVLTLFDNLILYNDVKDWYRSGGETYITSFMIKYERNDVIEVKNIILKAIVSLNSELQLINWGKRRQIMIDAKIPVSNWYTNYKGVIVEDFYPYDYDYVKNIYLLKDIAKKLDNLGFYCIDYLRDIRSDELGNPYYVDFGSDIGEPTFKKIENSINIFYNRFPDYK